MIKKNVLLSEAMKKVPNRFLLINVISKRVRQFKRDSIISGHDHTSLGDTALEELVEGKIKIASKEKTKKDKEKK